MSQHTPILVRDLKRLYVPTGYGLSKLRPCRTIPGQHLAQANVNAPGEKARRILIGSAPAVVHNFVPQKGPGETVAATFFLVRPHGALTTVATACTWKEALAVARHELAGPKAVILAVNVHFNGVTTSYMELPAHQEP